jgi:hypothetical protein
MTVSFSFSSLEIQLAPLGYMEGKKQLQAFVHMSYLIGIPVARPRSFGIQKQLLVPGGTDWLREGTGTGELSVRTNRRNANEKGLVTFGNSINEIQAFGFHQVSVVLAWSRCWGRLILLKRRIPVYVGTRVD